MKLYVKTVSTVGRRISKLACAAALVLGQAITAHAAPPQFTLGIRGFSGTNILASFTLATPNVVQTLAQVSMDDVGLFGRGVSVSRAGDSFSVGTLRGAGAAGELMLFHLDSAGNFRNAFDLRGIGSYGNLAAIKYCENMNRVVVASAAPSGLHLIDPATGQIQSTTFASGFLSAYTGLNTRAAVNCNTGNVLFSEYVNGQVRVAEVNLSSGQIRVIASFAQITSNGCRVGVDYLNHDDTTGLVSFIQRTQCGSVTAIHDKSSALVYDGTSGVLLRAHDLALAHSTPYFPAWADVSVSGGTMYIAYNTNNAGGRIRLYALELMSGAARDLLLGTPTGASVFSLDAR